MSIAFSMLGVTHSPPLCLVHSLLTLSAVARSPTLTSGVGHDYMREIGDDEPVPPETLEQIDDLLGRRCDAATRQSNPRLSLFF